MDGRSDFDGMEVGYDIPALPGMDEADIQTPCLVLDLDALERNIAKMGRFAKDMGVRHRVHGKMHKSVDVALLRLDQPILLPSIPPAATGSRPRIGDDVSIVSYAKDRSEAASLQDVCSVLGTQGRVAVLDCPVDFGASGAPVFRDTIYGSEVVSVISAKAEMNGKPIAVAVPVEGVLSDLMAQLDRAGRAAAPGVRMISGGRVGMGTGGAKFLKVDDAP